MFIPSVNHFGSGVYRCQMCHEIIDSGFNAALICDDCNAKIEASKMMESGGINNTNGLPTDNLLLDTYYKRDIKISFSYQVGSSWRNKFTKYCTVMMIPNNDNWLEEKIKESETEMKKVGLKNISFKMIGKFSEMEDSEISRYMNEKSSRIDHLKFRGVTIPLILSIYGTAKSSEKDWSRFGWKLLSVFVLLVSLFITLSCIFLFIFAIYSHALVGALFLPLSILSGRSTYEAFETLKN